MSQTDSVPPRALKLIHPIVLAEDSKMRSIDHTHFLFFFSIYSSTCSVVMRLKSDFEWSGTRYIEGGFLSY